jgi:plastocyanin
MHAALARRMLCGLVLGNFIMLGVGQGTVLAAEHRVVVQAYTFSPDVLHIKAGDTVTWVNEEKRVSHSIAFVGRAEESERFFPGEQWSRVFPEPGRHEYRCGPHPEMLGVIVVEE